MDAAVPTRTDDHWIRRHPWLVITAVCAILFVPTDLVLGYARIPANHRLFHPYYHHDLASRASFEETWGRVTYRINTNSLGFKDAEVRDINLFPAFIGAEDPASTIKRWFIDGDNHWNEAGHREVADRLAAALHLP